jgi:hypothetical protein
VARPSKEHILSEVRRLAAANGGKPLGIERFEVATGIRQTQWRGIYWARWGDALVEAGYEPNTFQGKEHSDERLLQFLADATRDIGRFPTTADFRIWRQTNPGAPNDKVFRNRLGTTAEMFAKARDFAQARDEYADVAAILVRSAPARGRRSQVPEPENVVTGVVYLIRMAEFYKVGKSNDPGRRLYELGLRLPEKHDVVHAIETDDPSGIEAYWHRRFARQRSNGEWFRLSSDDVAAFRRRTYM